MPNLAHALDAARTSCLRSEDHWSRASDARRWTTCAMHHPLIALLALLMLNSTGFPADAQGPREPFIDGKRLGVWLDQYQTWKRCEPGPRRSWSARPQGRASRSSLGMAEEAKAGL